MLGDFITRGLVLVLGFAYPAFECFKTVEKNKVEIEELRFWCQYWIIVAVLTVFERIGDIFISWLPMYGEMKLAVFIYLWYPKTKGTGYVYETLFRPYVAKHETDIDRNLQELRARVWDLAIYYWENCTNIGQTTFFQIIDFLVAQSGKIRNITSSEKAGNQPNKQKQPSDRTTTNRVVAQTPKSDVVQVHLHSQTEFIRTDNDESEPGSTHESETGLRHNLHAAKLKLRRSKGFN
uniref:HVA22-like protein n=1 Tax=Davidia involucrata TaxID=16924 RepID=A0A5B7BB37_DAVIN